MYLNRDFVVWNNDELRVFKVTSLYESGTEYLRTITDVIQVTKHSAIVHATNIHVNKKQTLY